MDPRKPSAFVALFSKARDLFEADEFTMAREYAMDAAVVADTDTAMEAAIALASRCIDCERVVAQLVAAYHPAPAKPTPVKLQAGIPVVSLVVGSRYRYGDAPEGASWTRA